MYNIWKKWEKLAFKYAILLMSDITQAMFWRWPHCAEDMAPSDNFVAWWRTDKEIIVFWAEVKYINIEIGIRNQKIQGKSFKSGFQVSGILVFDTT